jgi:hypothetical protein
LPEPTLWMGVINETALPHPTQQPPIDFAI